MLRYHILISLINFQANMDQSETSAIRVPAWGVLEDPIMFNTISQTVKILKLQSSRDNKFTLGRVNEAPLSYHKFASSRSVIVCRHFLYPDK